MVEKTERFETFVRRFSKGCAWTVFFIGLFFFLSWQLGYYSPLYCPFIEWPIPYSAVLSIFFAGIAFLNVIYFPRFPLYRWLGGVILLIAGMRLIETVFQLNLGLSFILQKTLFTSSSIFPPMVVVGAINFFLIGLVLLFWPQKKRTLGFSTFSTFASILLVFISLQALVIYLLPIEPEDLVEQVPIHYYSAALQAIFAFGWFGWNLHLDLVQKIRVTKWMPLIIVAVILFLHAFFVIAFVAQSKESVYQSISYEAKNLEYLIQTHVTEIQHALVRQSNRIASSKTFDLQFLLSDGQRYLDDEPALVTLGWLDDRFELQKQIAKEGNQALYLFSIPVEIREMILKQGSSVEIINYFDRTHQRYVSLAPVFWDSKFQGASFFFLDLRELLIYLDHDVGLKKFQVGLFYDGMELYQSANTHPELKIFGSLDSRFAISSVPFELRLTLIEMFSFQKIGKFLLITVSVAVFIGAFLSGISLYLFQKMKEKARLLEQLNHHLDVSFAIMRVMNKASTIQQASDSILEILHREYGWEILLYWRIDPKSRGLSLIDFNTISPSSFKRFQSATNGLSPESSLAVYAAFEKEEFVWSQDFGSESYSRSAAAKEEGIRGAVTIPVFEKGEAVGVLELFKTTYLEEKPDEEWLNFIAIAIREFSRFILRSEAQVANSELAAMVNAAPVAVYTLDLHYRIQRWNRAAELLYGWTESEMAQKDVRDLFPPDRTSDLDKLMSIYRKESTDLYYQTVRLKKDKTSIPVGIYYSPILDENGNLTRVLVITRDITEQIRVEQGKDEFISMVSHELRTPLTSIMGALGIIQQKVPLEGEMMDLFSLAIRNSKRLAQLIDDIIDIEKIQLNRFEIHLRPVVVVDAVKEAAETSSVIAKANQVSLVIKEALPTAQIQGDFGRLVQVLLNLISNAIKFSSPGKSVSISMEKRGDLVRISIEDQGIGIEESLKPLIWNKFVKGQGGDTKSKGTGLGLTIVQNLVEQMGGSVGFTSEKNVGSTFYIEFPLIK